MTATVLSRLSVSGEVRAGNTVEIRWICNHPMETGFRVDDSGQRIARNILTTVRVLWDGGSILEAEPGTGWSSPAYLAFPFVVPAQDCTVTVEWQDDQGRKGQVQHRLTVS